MTLARRFLPVVLAVFCAASLTALAADIGDPVFPKDLPEDASRAELIYEKVSRGLFKTAGPDYGDLATDVSAYYGRGRLGFGSRTTIDLAAGVIEQDYALLWGGGIRQLLWDHPMVRVSAVAQVHYASAYREDHSGPGGARLRVKANWIDAEAALLLSHRFDAGEGRAVVPYAGVIGSYLTLDGQVKNGSTGARDNYEAEAQAPIGGVAGISFALPGGSALRAEGRYFDRFCFSAALSLAF